MSWQSSMLARLSSAVTTSGAWGYNPSGPAYAEPTALACLALRSHDRDPDLIAGGLSWLAAIQRVDGGVPICATVAAPCWPTPIAMLAWLGAPAPCRAAFTTAAKQATRRLLEIKGRPIAPNPRFFGHDTMLVAWPWVEGTHSWIEPTALALMALSAAGHDNHPRVEEGRRVIVDRALDDGGWNYGNTRVLHSTQRPFGSTTGLALMPLAGRPRTNTVDSAVAFLRKEIPTTRSPVSLSWGLLGLAAWDQRPVDADDRLADAAERALAATFNAHHDALLLLADAGWHPAVEGTISAAAGRGA